MKPNITAWLVCSTISLLLLSGCGGSSYVPRGVKVGKPYTVNGTTYRPGIDINYDKVGTASWYGPGFHGKKTATGEKFNQNALTAAHPTLPMPSMVRVTNLSNGRSLVVRVNDRGPFKGGRIIDLSKASAETLGIKGLAQVRVQYLPQETAEYIASLGVAVPPEMQYTANRQPMAPIIAEDSSDDSWGADEYVAEETVQVAPLQAITENDLDVPPPAAVQQVSYEPAITARAPEYIRSENKTMLRYFVQAGSYSLRENAKRVAERLALIGSPAIQEVQTPERTMYRVRLGPLADSGAAEYTLDQVRASGLPDAKIVLN